MPSFVLEFETFGGKEIIKNAIDDIREYADLFTVSITESLDLRLDDDTLTDYQKQIIKDTIYHN